MRHNIGHSTHHTTVILIVEYRPEKQKFPQTRFSQFWQSCLLFRDQVQRKKSEFEQVRVCEPKFMFFLLGWVFLIGKPCWKMYYITLWKWKNFNFYTKVEFKDLCWIIKSLRMIPFRTNLVFGTYFYKTDQCAHRALLHVWKI